VGSEAELLEILQPGVDGIVLEEGYYRSTFLPAVWESLPDPRQFLAQLKRKAGLPIDHWSERIRIFRYETEAFG
jgi:AMMECR1 domain-containing protein